MDFKYFESERDKFQLEQIKSVLALSSGTLIVSLSILNVKIPLTYKGVLLISWAFLIISLIFGIMAMTAGISRYARTVDGAKNKLTGKIKKLYENGKVLTKTEAASPGAQVWGFTIGLLSFMLFVLLNIYKNITW